MKIICNPINAYEGLMHNLVINSLTSYLDHNHSKTKCTLFFSCSVQYKRFRYICSWFFFGLFFKMHNVWSISIFLKENQLRSQENHIMSVICKERNAYKGRLQNLIIKTFYVYWYWITPPKVFLASKDQSSWIFQGNQLWKGLQKLKTPKICAYRALAMIAWTSHLFMFLVADTQL